jgi:hypothetical protein
MTLTPHFVAQKNVPCRVSVVTLTLGLQLWQGLVKLLDQE